MAFHLMTFNTIRKLIIFCSIALFSVGLYGQNEAYFGKSVYLDIDYSISPKFLFSPKQHYVVNDDGSYALKYDKLRLHMFGVTINKTLENAGGLGLELKYAQHTGASSRPIGFYGSNGFVSDEVDFSTIGAAIIYHYQNTGIHRPMGLSQDIGIGLSRHKITNAIPIAINDTLAYYYYTKDPYYTPGYLANYQANGQSIIPDGISFKELRIIYGMNVRKAVSPSLAIKFGYRFCLNYVLANNSYLDNDVLQDIHRDLRTQRLEGFFELNLGLTYMIK